MKTKVLLLMTLFLAFFCSAQAAEHVKGNGKLSTKKIKVEDFNAIKVDGVIDFSYIQSDEQPFVEVTVDENLHPYVNIEIKERELTVNFKGAKVDHFTKFIVKTNSKWLKQVKASGNANFMTKSVIKGDELKISANSNCLVQLMNLVEVGKLDLNVSGSANMVGDNIKVKKLECSITGNGTIRLKKGTADDGNYSITTAGEIMAYGMAVKNLGCKVTGKGVAQIHAIDLLKASIVGKGSVDFKQRPATIEKNVLGKGVITYNGVKVE